MVNDFAYDPVSNRLDRILTAKPGYLALVDLSYDYDPAGNIASIPAYAGIDGVRQEERSYQYDFLDRLTYAGVYAGPQMIEERYYTYNQIGNLLSFRHRYPSAGQGRGAWAVGGSASADGKALRGSFNGLSSSSMSSGQQQGNHSGSAVMPYVYGFGADAPDGGYNGRGSLHSGQIMSNNVSYSGAGSFNPMTGATEGSGFDGRGVLAFTRGIAGGFGGWEGNEYTGPFGESTIDYTYPDNHVRPHAVTARSNGDVFSYDANGNMTSRTQDSVAWTQVFDAENRLVSVSNNATLSTTTTYVYDGSGGRLKRIVNDGSTITTTLYVAGMEIETVGSTETKRTVYYPSGGAFRVVGGENAGLYYRHSDHLGSTSVLSDASGMKVTGSDVVYAPFGEVRSGEQIDLTDFGYTGQRRDDSTGGLMYYGARYYLPGIQHFVSADTIVADVKSQSLNRYAYVKNNPTRYTDPSGHITQGEEETKANNLVHELLIDFGVTIVPDWGYSNPVTTPGWMPGEWTYSELLEIKSALIDMSVAFAGAVGVTCVDDLFINCDVGQKLIKELIGPITIVQRTPSDPKRPAETHPTGNVITLNPNDTWRETKKIHGNWTVVHEIGHVWDNYSGHSLRKELEAATGGETICNSSGVCNYHWGGVPMARANRTEDFANSVAGFVYPSRAESLIKRVFKRSLDFTTEPRYNFVKRKIVGDKRPINAGVQE